MVIDNSYLKLPEGKNFHASTNAKHPQDLNARDSWGGFHKDLCKIMRYLEVAPGHLRTSRSYHKDLCKMLFLPGKIDIAFYRARTSRAPDRTPACNTPQFGQQYNFHFSSDVTDSSRYLDLFSMLRFVHDGIGTAAITPVFFGGVRC